MVSREQLLELDKKRKVIEEEINTLTNYLEQPGMPGVNGKLIDNEGFPLAGLDLMEIRKARNRLAILQNDYKALMETIEQKMQAFFEQQSKEKLPDNEDRNRNSNKNYQEPLAVSVPEESKSIEKNKSFVPFAYISSVIENSPADEAGLKAGDGILRLDVVEIGKFTDPLIKVAEIVRSKKDNEIEIEVARKNDEDRLEFKKLKLIPHVWSGQGLLGCKLVLDNKK